MFRIKAFQARKTIRIKSLWCERKIYCILEIEYRLFVLNILNRGKTKKKKRKGPDHSFW